MTATSSQQLQAALNYEVSPTMSNTFYLYLQISNGINSCLMETFPDGSGVTVLAEPGRYFIDAGLTLAASVIGKKHSRFKVYC